MGCLYIVHPTSGRFFECCNGLLTFITDPENKTYPPIYDRGQILAWTWSYVGRAVLEMWRATNEDRFRRLFVDTARKVMACRDDRYGKVDTVQNRVVKSWGANFPINGKPERVTDVTVTGLITLPILQFANMLNPGDPDFKEFSGLVTDLGASLWEFERFYRYLPDIDAGYYANMGDEKIVEPISHYAALGAAMVEMTAFTKDERYLERAVRLHNFMRRATFVDSLGGASLPYMPTPDFPRDFIPEAFWKAAVTHELPYALWRNGIVATREEMTGYAKAIATGVFLDPDTLGLLTRFYKTGQFFHLKTGWDDFTHYIRSLVSFAGDAVFLNDFHPGLDETLARYMVNHPKWFENGMMGSAFGSYARARSYQKQFAI
jgi:hypothetical protein